MKKSFRIPTVVAASIALGYQKIQAAKEYFRSASTDPDCPGPVRTDMSVINAQLTLLHERIDNRIPIQNKERFYEQVKNDDTMVLENINRLYFKIPPAQRTVLETIATEMSKGIEFNINEIQTS
jgi:hypothetical protein